MSDPFNSSQAVHEAEHEPQPDSAPRAKAPDECYSCGAPLRDVPLDDADTCPHCGADLAEQSAGTHANSPRHAYSTRHRLDPSELDRFPA